MTKLLVRLVLLLALVGIGSLTTLAQSPVSGWCEQGNQTVTTQGLASTTKVQRSHPSCTVTVFNAGTVTPATIFSDSIGTPKANPFTASANGSWTFYGANGDYDVQLSGASITTAFTERTVRIGNATTIGIGGSGTANVLPKFTASSTLGDSILTESSRSIRIAGSAGTAGELRFGDGDNSNYVSFKSATSVTSNVTWTLPSADGSNGQFLRTNGSGTLTWATVTGTGITSLNALTVAAQLFVDVDDTNVTLAISSSADTHTFTMGWSGTLAKARQNAATVYNDAANTWSTGAQDMGSATSFKLPTSAGAAPTANGLVAYDSTANRYIGGHNGTARTFAITADTLAAFASTTSAQLAGVISDETGSAALVFANTPTLVTPVLGVATATSINKVAITAPASSATLTISDGKTLASTASLTLAGTDSTTITFQGTDTYVGRTTTDTLTNKTLSTSTSVSASISWGDGVKQTFNPDATNSGLNVGSQAGDVGSPANGDIWYDSTANKFRCRQNGSTTDCISTSSVAGGSNTQVQYNNAGAFGGITGVTSDGTNMTAGSGNLRATSPRITASILDTNGNSWLGITATGSATQFLTISNNTATNAVALSVNAAATAASSQAGTPITMTASNATAGDTNAGAAAGGAITFTSGNAARLTSGNADGGHIRFVLGTGIGTGLQGQILLPSGTTTHATLNLDNNGATDTGLTSSSTQTVSIIQNAVTKVIWYNNSSGMNLSSDRPLLFSNNTNAAAGTGDVGFYRNASGIIEVNNGTLGQWGQIKLGIRDAVTNAISRSFTIGHQTSGTAAASFGGGMLFNLDSSTTADQNAAAIDVLWTTATHASRSSDIVFKTVLSAAALAEAFRVNSAGQAVVSVGSASAPGLAISGSLNSGIHAVAGTSISMDLGGNEKFRVTSSYMEWQSNWTAISFGTGHQVNWTNNASGSSGSFDLGLARAAANNLRVTNGSSGIGYLLHGRVVTAKTTDYTVVVSDSNTFFTNTGAGAGVIFTLPTPAAGLTYEIYRDANQTVTVDVGGSVTIQVGSSVTTAGGNVTLDAVGSRIRVVAISSTQWVGDLSGTATFN